jgi:hypothetical protein
VEIGEIEKSTSINLLTECSDYLTII